ncbi:MAG: hypothetical protein LBP35_00770 [Candidatus Ancillula trichonymphae]|nr:hypothetical protein [Candidatus Ancillula trichonymphae]
MGGGVGLFGVTNHAEIKNLGVVSADVIGEIGVGGLVGWNYDSSVITNSYTSGTTTIKGNSDVGGLVGHNDKGSKVVNSYVAASVIEGGYGVGGLVGVNSGSVVVKNSLVLNSQTTVTDNGDRAGVVVGHNDYDYGGTIKNPYGRSDVNTNFYS